MQIIFTVYVPTNSGLRYVREQGLAKVIERISNPVVREVRGEKIPELVNQSEDSSIVYGITGEDLFLDYCIDCQDNRDTNNTVLIERLNLLGTGPYAMSVFGLPTLCVLGKGGLRPRDYASQRGGLWKKEYLPDFRCKSVILPLRYLNLAINRTQIGIDSGPIWIKTDSSQVDVTAANDKSIDYAIDIVVTGKTCEKLGLGIYTALARSDGVIIGTIAALKLWKEIELKQII